MKYEINTKTFTLAKCTPNRLAAYCTLMGINDFNDLRNQEFMSEMTIRYMNLTKDAVKTKELLAVCLNESVSEVNAGEIASEIIDQVSNDFFSQRFPNLPKPQDL